jgi:hypothetical protein
MVVLGNERWIGLRECSDLLAIDALSVHCAGHAGFAFHSRADASMTGRVSNAERLHRVCPRLAAKVDVPRKADRNASLPHG